MFKKNTLNIIIKRWKHNKKIHWSKLEKKTTNKDKALIAFDDFYGSVFGIRWKSLRISLLSEHKYIALVNNFGETEETCSRLENEGAINVRSIYNAHAKNIKTGYLGNSSDKTTLSSRVDQFIDEKLRENINTVFTASNDYKTYDIPSTSPSSSDITDSNEPDEDKYLEKFQKNDINIETFKKPLEKSLLEDTDIDLNRLIDTELGESALQEFIPATKLKGIDDWVFESEHYKYYKTTNDFPLNYELENEIEIPENLQMYTYEKCNVSNFPAPKRSYLTGVYSHFLMDGSSILPPLMLQLKPGDEVLDACAAPGGKSLLMLQTMYPDVLVCNDEQESRVNRIYKIFRDYLIDFDKNWNRKRCFITEQDARHLNEYGMYDKILVDVPCTNDRHSVMNNENNIFKPQRIKERLRLPELQAAILINCIQLLRPGGSLVYSTCSLSPVQNDGVVHMALSKLFTDFNITVTIKDLREVIVPFSGIFKFEHPKGLKYGQLVLPYLYANFGPMYFSKIVRN